MSRDDLASLVSNDLSRPIIAGQERSFREGYVKGSVSMHRRNHELKAGLEVDYGSIHERFNYIIADPDRFDPGTPGTFNFAGSGLDREPAGFAQDLLRLGQWTVSAGVRWDCYHLLVEKSALSPRLGDLQQFGQAVSNRINFNRGRVRPSLSLDASVGTDFVTRGRLTVRLQADIQNLTNRINIINFAGLFSGTGIAPPRNYAVRLDVEF